MIMGSSRAVLLLNTTTTTSFSSVSLLHFRRCTLRKWSSKATDNDNASSLPPPDVPRLAQTARISLTPQQAEEFAPKIRQVIDWLGQLQAVDLESVEPALRAETEGDNLRDDNPVTFEKREAIIYGIPSYEEPFIKVPQVMNKE